MSVKKPRVLIVGGSHAGLTAATALMQTHLFEVIVYDRSFSLGTGGRRPMNGGGVAVHDESIKILNRLGVGDMVSLPMPFQDARDRHGRVIREWSTPLNSFYWGDVLASLYQSATKAGAIVHFKKTVVTVRQNLESVTLEFSDGATAVGDCVIGADGILSRVRSYMFPDRSDLMRHAGYFVWRGLIRFDDLPIDLKSDAEANIPKETMSYHISERSHAVFFYLHDALNWIVYFNSNPEGNHMYLPRNEVVGNVTKVPTGDEIESFYKTAEKLYTPTIVKILRATDGLFTNEMYDMDVLSSYHSGRCVLIGDAAHPALPHLGVGTNNAIQDAYALSRALSSVSADLNSRQIVMTDLDAAFQIYEAERLEHNNNLAMKSRKIGRIRQGIFSKTQNMQWDLTCTSLEFRDMIDSN